MKRPSDRINVNNCIVYEKEKPRLIPADTTARQKLTLHSEEYISCDRMHKRFIHFHLFASHIGMHFLN